MLRQFYLSSELQQLLSGIDSAALSPITWDITFEGDAPVLPVDIGGIRRSLVYSKLSDDGMATPTPEYNCFLSNLLGDGEMSLTGPR